MKPLRLLLSWPLALVVFFGLFGLYAAVLHPRLVNWGSTAAERQMTLPGDELKTTPVWQTTRAVTIDAPASVVWAWLIQHGQDRGGFYSHTWLENLTGADIHNASTLHPEWQQRAVGDAIPMYGPRVLMDITRVKVVAAEPSHLLTTRAVTGDTTAWVLVPIDGETTRLITRERSGTAGAGAFQHATDVAYHWLIWDPMHFTMVKGMMLGIEARAEGHASRPLLLELGARIGWAGAGAVLAGLFVVRRQARWLLLPAIVVLPAIALGHDADAALAGFLAAGITLFGALTFGRRWWPPYLLIASAVMLVLLLTRDPYLVFGLGFDALLVGGALFAMRAGSLRLPALLHPSPAAKV